MSRPGHVNVPSGFGAFFGSGSAERDPPIPTDAGARRQGVRRPVSIRLPRRRDGVDALLPLINIVFLLLIFLMSVGTLGGSLPPGLSVARTAGGGDPTTIAGALVVLPDGSLRIGREPIERAALVQALRSREPADAKRVTVVADRQMPAAALLDVMRDVADAGIPTVSLVTSDGRTP